MQDKILLGFLQDGEKTGYQIKKMMEQSTGYFFNTSLGSIYPAFRKLQKEGMVKMKQKVSEGRVKKIYSITKRGIDCFQSWLKEDITIPKVRDEVLLKIYFFANLDPATRKEKLSCFIGQLEEKITEFTNLKSLISKHTSVKDKKKVQEYLKKYDLDEFRMEMIEFGIEQYTFMHSWYQRLLERLEGEPLEN